MTERDPLVRYETKGRVALLTLTNPPANCYSHEMMRDLDESILRARFDQSVDVLVLTGEGEKFFCAGADIEMLKQADPVWKYYFCLHSNETLLRLEHTPKLVIGAIQGHCVGGGLEVALACDLRIGAKGRGKLGLPEAKLGVLPGTGGTQRLVRLLGASKAMELMVESRTFGYEEALELGILNKLFEGEGFLDQVLAYAEGLCCPQTAAMATGHIKRACQTGAGLPLEQGLALERELQAKLFSSRDAGEGLAAFVEKRPPAFEGK